MKLLWILVSSLAFIDDIRAMGHCYLDVQNACQGYGKNELPNCNSLHSGYQYTKDDLLSEYANELIQRSYHYLLLSKSFGNYIKIRPGLRKLYKTLADDAWHSGIRVMQHITKRGGSHYFNATQRIDDTNFTTEVNELMSLAFALDAEKQLAKGAYRIHHYYSNANGVKHYDPEICRFVQETFFGKQAAHVQMLSAYKNKLTKLMDKGDTVVNTPLGLYLFDQYLVQENLKVNKIKSY